MTYITSKRILAALAAIGLVLAVAGDAVAEPGDWRGTRPYSASDAQQEPSYEREPSWRNADVLLKLARDVTQEMATRSGRFSNGEFELIGREGELRKLVRVLNRKKQPPNALLYGRAGVGKNAVVYGLAKALVTDGKSLPDSVPMPESLRGRRILQVDASSFVAGTMYRGQMEQRVKKFFEQAREHADEIVLFIDEAHKLRGGSSGKDGGAMNLAQLAKEYLGTVPVIANTTLDEYRNYFSRDEAFDRRFRPIHLEEPSQAETLELLRGVARDYAKTYNLSRVNRGALKEAIKLAARFVPNRANPAAALGVIDLAASAAEINGRRTVSKHWVASVLSDDIGLPIDSAAERKKRALEMPELLGRDVIGQPEAIEAVSRAIQRREAGYADPERPVGSFLFVGATGVGKTELAKSLARRYFHNERAIVNIDMAGMSQKSSLVGAPPGYVGYEDGGELTKGIQAFPGGAVVVLDEIEKADPEVIDATLRLLDEGRMTSGRGEQTFFRNAIVVATTNAGQKELRLALQRKREQDSGPRLGFKLPDRDGEDDSASDPAPSIRPTREQQIDAVKREFKPEFINRFDEVVVFNDLAPKDVRQIAKQKIDRFRRERFRDQHPEARLTLSDGALGLLVEKGYHPDFGARPMNRALQNHLFDGLSQLELRGRIHNDDHIHVRLEGRGSARRLQFLRVEPDGRRVELNTGPRRRSGRSRRD